MSRYKSKNRPLFKKAFKVVLAIFGVLLIVVLGLLLYVNIKKNDISKEMISLVNSEIKGTITVESVSLGSLFTYPHIKFTLKDVQVHAPLFDSAGKEELIIDIPQIAVLADFNTVFENEVILKEIWLTGGVLHLDRHSNGIMGISKAFLPSKSLSRSDSSGKAFILEIDTIHILNLQVELSDDKLDRNLTVLIDSMHANLDYRKSLIGGLAQIYGQVAELELTDSTKSPKMSLEIGAEYAVDLKERVVSVSSKNLLIDDVALETKLSYDYNDQSEFSLNLGTSSKGLNLGTFLTSEQDSSSKEEEHIHLTGNVLASTNIVWKSNPDKSTLNNVDATLSIEGKGLKVIGVDIDGYIDKFKRSQNFNLVDVGAVVLYGPAAIAITKGGDYTLLILNKQGDSTEVEHFVSDWSLNNGLLKTEDVAFRTPKSRISTSGSFNFKTDSLDFNIYVVDKRGCSLASQRYFGQAANPQQGKVGILKTLFGPIKNFFRNIGLSNCEIVYDGKVEHPKK